MLQPIDYASAFQQQGGLLGPVSQGLQLGAQFANIDQLRALRETQANELEFKRAQAEQNAAAAASRQQRIESIMASIQQKRQSGNLTQLDIDEAMVALPKDIADAYKNYGNSFSEEKQNYMRRVLMPIVAGKMNQERLISYLDTESSAAEHSGMKEEAQNIKKIKDMVSSSEQTPESIADSVVMAVGVFPWAKDIVETYNTGKREARAAAGESRAQAEEERKAAREPSELAKLTADARIKEAEANLAPEKLSVELDIKKEELKNLRETKTAEKTGIIPIEKRPEAEGKIRAEYSAQTKSYREVKDAYARVLASQDTAVGDVALIFGYMKMLDPGSVVREGEYATASNAAGVPERVLSLYNRLITGERLTPSQRKSFKGQAQQLFSSAGQQESVVRKGIERIAKEYGLNPNNIFYETQESSPVAPKSEAKDSATVRGRVVKRPPNMTEQDWNAYKKEMGAQ